MIEVEKRFQPTEEQLEKLLADSEFLGEKIIHDSYYDFEDARLFRGYVKFRLRNGNFELKVKNKNFNNKNINAEKEYEDEEEIKQYFNTQKDLKDFVKEEMVLWSEYSNNRKKYKNGDFSIDLDNLSFGYSVVEIELMVGKEEDVKEAEDRILMFAKKYNLDTARVPSKGEKYFEIVKPELYKKFYE